MATTDRGTSAENVCVGMGTKEEKDLWIEEKSHLKEGEVETGEGVGRGGDHPLHPPGGRGQETEGGDHGVRFLSP